jgi:hypothetical protein
MSGDSAQVPVPGDTFPDVMRKLTPVDLKPWMLPLLVAAVCIPVIGGFALAGPAVGLPMGSLAAAVIVIVAIRSKFDEPIEVASSDGERHVLVVALTSIEDPEVAEQVASAVRGPRPGAPADALVLAPALNSTISHWLSDLRGARLGAQERLAVSLGVLAAAGVEARGRVGDTDPVQATEDTLRDFPATEVVFVTGGRKGGRTVDDVRRRLDRPVACLVAGADAEGA